MFGLRPCQALTCVLLVCSSAFAFLTNTSSLLDAIPWRTGNHRVDTLVQRLTPSEKVSLLHGHPDPADQNQAGYVPPVPRLGIPRARLCDGEAGINVVENATAIPVQINVAATWDKSAAYAAGYIIGREARLLKQDIALSPRVNILRDPVTGNFWQSYSEDPFLNAQLGVAAVNAIQSQGTMADPKQIGPSSTGASAGDTNSIVDLQTLHEVYWSAPGALLKAGAATVMCSYAQINGIPACQYEPLYDAVRRVYNSSAIMISDWEATHSLTETIVAGMDWEMPTGTWYDSFYDAVYVAKNLSETYLDRSLGRILEKYDRFEMLDRGTISLQTDPLAATVVEEDARIAYDIAVKSGVLLKNDGGVLPVSKESSFAVIGPNGLQYSHGTNFAERAYGIPDRQVSPIDAIRARTGRTDIPTAVGIDQEGTIIPSSALTTLNGNTGLSRNDTLGRYAVDAQIDFDGESALPRNASYEWQGHLNAPTSGHYTISLQRKMPEIVGYSSADYGDVFSIGSLSINGSSIASGYRTLLDGGVRPISNSITTRAGWDIIKGYVYLSAGRHRFSAGIVGLLQQPISLRLAWVTPEQRERNIQDAVAAAKSFETPIVFAFANSPAQIGMTLDDGQDELVTRVAAVNPKTVVVLNNAEPVTMPWLESVSSVLEMMYAGQEGGWATADLLFGNHYPQGRLPVTYPKSVNQTVTRNPYYPGRVDTEDGNATFSEGVNSGYRWYKHIDCPVLFPFGYGLTLTTFEYSDLAVHTAKVPSKPGKWQSPKTENPYQYIFTVSFTVANTGDKVGVEVPQIYIGPPLDASHTYPGVQFPSILLAGFDNLRIEPGQRLVSNVSISVRQLSFYSVESGLFELATGERDVWVGKNVDDIVLSGTVKL
ncbi:Family 3 glycoside hydrolase [Lecanosticta acicola]|uniref:beta-glucosidase n=1 Tax=Lecanosticta acicola TaxID=111012 RepID=A0AAI8Z3Y6_9PEZI|nr:Family 3 glycoside hydrolase [Lecanosticta acicola]